MPLPSGVVPNFRAAVGGTVGALLIIIPPLPGPAAALCTDHHQATAVEPPATACVAAGSCTAVGTFGGPGRPLEPMAATQSRGRWSRAFPLALPAGAAAQPYAQVSGIACHSAGNCVAVGDYQYGRSGNTQAFVAI